MTLEDVPEISMSRYVMKLEKKLNTGFKNEILNTVEVLDYSITHVTLESNMSLAGGTCDIIARL